MKKRIFALGFGVILVFSLCGCSEEKDTNSDTVDTINLSTEENADTDAASDGAASNNHAPTDLLEEPEVAAKLDEINNIINEQYYFDIDKEKQEEALYDGIMAGLDDPYSVYYTADEFKDLMEDTTGEFVGIGAVVTQGEDKKITIVRPIPDSPAQKAGLQAGDVVVEVDGTAIVDQDLNTVVGMIRGQKGTSAHLKIYREGESDYLEFDVERDVVHTVTVNSKILDNDIGYIQVDQFTQNTTTEFKNAIDELINNDVKGLIVDLRDNPGGVLGAVVSMCNYIMPEGMIVKIEDRNGKTVSKYNADNTHSVDLPMVVLVNGNSASASEIFTGAMKDTERAKIVGTKTYGKGIVQSIIPLSDGTAVKITTAKYFTPNGIDIHKTGIEPDYEVELPDGRTNAVNLPYEEDTQLHKAEEVVLEMIK